MRTDEGATVEVDGSVAGTGRYQDKLPAGPHAIRITERGKVPYRADVDLRVGGDSHARRHAARGGSTG